MNDAEDITADDIINDSQEDSYIDEGEVLLFSLSEKYKKLKKKQQKAAMKIEEEEWIMFEGKQ